MQMRGFISRLITLTCSPVVNLVAVAGQSCGRSTARWRLLTVVCMQLGRLIVFAMQNMEVSSFQRAVK